MFGDMSCLMYQPYASYFPYQRGGSGTSAYQDPLKKFHASLDKVHDSLHTTSSYPGTLGLPTPPSHTPHSLLGASPPSNLSTSTVITKEELVEDKDNQPKDTQFISANCVVFSYINGDVAASVDEHFSKALSQTNSASGGGGGYNSSSDSQNSNKSLSHWKGSSSNTIPMSQRNFPPSFWNSNYQPPPSTTSTLPGFGGHYDPYNHMASSLHNMSSFAQDPWRYSFSSHPHQGHHSAYTHHPSFHDLSSYSSANRFNTQFSSLMPSAAAAAAGKLSSLTGQYDLHSKHHSTDPWATATTSRYHADPFAASTSLSTTHHHQDPYGLYGGALSGTC